MIVHAGLRCYVLLGSLLICCWLGLVACNEAPTTVGASLVPGTDTLYALTSGSDPMLDSLHTVSAYPVMYNGTYFLFGKTPTSEGRLFLEIIEYPSLGDTTKWQVLECALGMLPQTYLFGDTTDATLGMRGYDLAKVWGTQITWDSVWDANGTTDYYSESGERVVDTTVSVGPTDTLVYVNFNKNSVRRWLIVGADSARRASEQFGMVLLPTNASSIRQYRNARLNQQVMFLRVITKNVDKETPDTTFLKTAVASFVNTQPPANASDLIVQGARIHSSKLAVHLDSLPTYSIIVGAALTVNADLAASEIGSGGIDELLELTYTATSGRVIRFETRVTDGNRYLFPNVSAIAQQIQLDGGKGVLELRPADAYDTWRMNRIALYNGIAQPELAPKLTVIFTVPTVFQ